MIKKLTEIRAELLTGIENSDLLYIKMQINKIDTLIYNASKNDLDSSEIAKIVSEDCLAYIEQKDIGSVAGSGYFDYLEDVVKELLGF